MNNLNIWSNKLGFLAWVGLYVPVRLLPDGSFQFFTNQGDIVQFEQMHLCLAFLRGVHHAEGGN